MESEVRIVQEPFDFDSNREQQENNCNGTKFLIATVLAIVIGFVLGWIYSSLSKGPTQSDLFSDVATPTQVNFKAAIDQRTKDIERIVKSFSQMQCVPNEPTVFYNYERNSRGRKASIFFQTFDGLYLKDCANPINNNWSVSLPNVMKWNKDRQIIQWSYKHVYPGGNLIYFRDGAFNPSEILVLSKFLGIYGSLQIIGSQKSEVCMTATFDMQKIPTIYKLGKEFSKPSYNMMIGNDTILSDPNIFSKLSQTPVMLLYSKNPEFLKQKFPNHKIQRFKLEDQDCGNGIYEDQISGEGYYSLTVNQTKAQRRVISKEITTNPILAALESESLKQKMQEYNRLIQERGDLKQCDYQGICYDVERKESSGQFIYSVYGRRLFGVKQEEVRSWEKERQSVQWVRAKGKGTLYYEMEHSFNLVAIIEIAHIIRDSQLIVRCSPKDCALIGLQLESTLVSNVKLIRNSDLENAKKADMIITDNVVLIKECLKDNFTSRGKLLSFFTTQRSQSLKAMRQFFVNYNLREVIVSLDSKQCSGFQYLNAYWNSTNPHGFYEISPSSQVIYVFWDSNPSQTSPQKLSLLKKMFKSSVEVKIVNDLQFMYFQMLNNPFHPGFSLLTANHKEDYSRVYLMHYYGGAYASLSYYTFDWKAYFDRLENDVVRVASGYKEQHEQSIACYEQGTFPPCEQIRKAYLEIFGGNYYIFKKGSTITREWMKSLTRILDEKLDSLKQHRYSLQWSEIGNQLLARTLYKFRNLIYLDMPRVVMPQ